MKNECTNTEVDNIENDVIDEEHNVTNVRPKRIAAMTGELRRRVLEDVL